MLFSMARATFQVFSSHLWPVTPHGTAQVGNASITAERMMGQHHLDLGVTVGPRKEQNQGRQVLMVGGGGRLGSSAGVPPGSEKEASRGW